MTGIGEKRGKGEKKRPSGRKILRKSVPTVEIP